MGNHFLRFLLSLDYPYITIILGSIVKTKNYPRPKKKFITKNKESLVN